MQQNNVNAHFIHDKRFSIFEILRLRDLTITFMKSNRLISFLAKKLIHIFHFSHQIHQQLHIFRLNDYAFNMNNWTIRHFEKINDCKIMRKNNAHIDENKKKRFYSFLQSIQDVKLNAQVFVEIFLHNLLH